MYSNSWTVMCFSLQFLFAAKNYLNFEILYLDSTIIQINGHYLNSTAFEASRLYIKFFLIALLWLVQRRRISAPMFGYKEHEKFC